nr:GDSL esterase/lipase LIP-4-like [Ipomoea batatas]
MELKLVFTSTTMLLLCSPLLATAIECQNPLIFNFGDSNSDTGGYAAAYGVYGGYPAGRKFFHRYMSSYLESLTPNFKTGVNFAVGSATVLSESNFFSLKAQLDEFRRFHACSLILHFEGITSMFGEEDFRNAVYLIDIGQNDITGAFSNHSKSKLEILESIPSFIAGIKAAIETMYRVGGRKFWVHNTGPAGFLPLMLAKHTVGHSRAEFDKAGCFKPLNDLAQEFNSQLYRLCEDLRAELQNATVVYIDMYTIKYDLISNSPLYGNL